MALLETYLARYLGPRWFRRLLPEGFWLPLNWRERARQ